MVKTTEIEFQLCQVWIAKLHLLYPNFALLEIQLHSYFVILYAKFSDFFGVFLWLLSWLWAKRRWAGVWGRGEPGQGVTVTVTVSDAQ